MRASRLCLALLASCGRIGFEHGATSASDASIDAPGVVDCTTLSDGAPCDDRNICTATSSCQAGSCVAQSPQASCTVAHSENEFDSTQGTEGWWYGFWKAEGDASYDPDLDFELGVWAVDSYEPMNNTRSFIYLAWWGAHPVANPLEAPVRRWISDVQGPANVIVAVRKTDTSCGDGVAVRLVVDGVPAWTPPPIAFDDNVGYTMPVPVELAVGTRVDFTIAANAGDACDTTECRITVVNR